MIRKLIRKASNLFHPVLGEIWCLHRVVEDRSIYPSNRALEITPDYLEALIVKYQAEGFSFVGIDDLLGSKPVFPKKRVNISFDDGFRDIYHTAYPLFKRYRIPFTVYLTTGFPEGKADIWWIQLEQCCPSAEAFEAMMKQIYESGKPMAEEMHSLTGTQPDPLLCQSHSLSWADIKEMVGSGLCTIGSHTVSHPGLTRIGKDAVIRELEESRRIIRERIGRDAVHLSYPHSMENEAVRAAVSDAGYVSATMGYGGRIRRGDDCFRLNRNFIVQE